MFHTAERYFARLDRSRNEQSRQLSIHASPEILLILRVYNTSDHQRSVHRSLQRLISVQSSSESPRVKKWVKFLIVWKNSGGGEKKMEWKKREGNDAWKTVRFGVNGLRWNKKKISKRSLVSANLMDWRGRKDLMPRRWFLYLWINFDQRLIQYFVEVSIGKIWFRFVQRINIFLSICNDYYTPM